MKEVKICWDWEDIVIPKEYIKELKYKYEKQRGEELYCNNVILELDLQYIKTHNIAENEKLGLTVFDSLQQKNIWNIEIVNDNNETISLILPSNRKDNYCKEEQYVIKWEAKNLCEHHKIQKNTYCIEWNEVEEKNTYMNPEEIRIFFKKQLLSKIFNGNHYLGTEVLSHILEQNRKEKSISDRIEELSKKDNGVEVILHNFKEDIREIIYRIHDVDARRGKVYGIKKGYILTEEYYPLHGIDIIIVNAKNHSHHWNFNFVLIPKIEKEEDKKSIYEVICNSEPKEDTKNYFSRTILVFNDEINVEEFMVKFYRKVYKNTNKIDIKKEKLLFTTNKEINKIWYDIHKQWDLL